MKKWLREPLLHFLLIGGLIFLIYGMQDKQISDHENRILITGSDVDRMVALWEKKWQRMPSPIEVEGLIEQHIQEEVLYREALAMGLDKNDAVVRRRLAQKVEFISSDLAALAEPTDNELDKYLEVHPKKFRVPDRISFVQVYLNADKRGPDVKKDAENILADLNRPNSDTNFLASGDPFMFGQQHQQLTKHDVLRLFGKEFAESLFSLSATGWQGPIQSGFGLHLVRIDKRTPGSRPGLNEVREKVREEWLAEQRIRMNRAFYNELRKRYEIIIETDDRALPQLAKVKNQ